MHKLIYIQTDVETAKYFLGPATATSEVHSWLVKTTLDVSLGNPHSMYVLYHKPLYSCIPWSVSHFPISKNCCLEVMEFAYKY